MRKILFFIIPAFILAVILFLSYQIFFLKRNEKGALQVTANPNSKVYLNGNLIGETPLCKCEAGDMLPVGEYVLRLVPSDASLVEFQQKITVSKSVLTVVDRRFAKGASSEGSIISLTPIKDKKAIELLTLTFPDKADVYIDNNPSGHSPLLLKNLTESDHIIKIRKNGYKEKSVRIHTPAGYKLTAAIYLGVDEQAASGNAPTTIPSTTPTPTQAVAKVVILETPTGFLRVRQSASLGAPEIGRVTPGQSYELIEEQTGWFQIKLSDGNPGWISSQYASKQ
jgi:hypothetical protein